MSSDLRTVLDTVLDEPLVEPRPVEDVMRHGRRIVTRHRRRHAVVRFALLVVVTTLGLRAVVLDATDDRVRVTDGPKPPAESATTTLAPPPVPFHDKVPTGPSPVDAPAPSPPSPAAARTPAAAAGEPGRCEGTGSLQVGVDIAWVFGARAAADRVNRAGGVCGRLVDVSTGSGTANSSVVVEPYVVPVASLARITAHHAYADLDARTFAVVYERAYAAAATALAEYVAGLPGATLRISQPVEAGHVAHATAAVAQACGSGCDALLLAAGPATVTEWLDVGGPLARRETAALPATMTAKWPSDCVRDAGERCRQVAVWSPIRVPTGGVESTELRQFESDAKGTGQQPWDAQFAAGYVGMRRLLASVQQVAFTSDLIGPLLSAREVRMEVEDGRFVGWRDVGEGWARDPLAPR